MDSFFGLLLGTLVLRPYVFAFLLLYLFAAVANMGWRRTLLFTMVGWGVAFTAESLSIRVGIPFGLYHYLPTTVDRELWIAGVPFMDSLSFVFLAYASWTLASLALLPLSRDGKQWWNLSFPAHGRLGGAVFALTVVLFVLIDVVIDPVALRGDRWFLGQIFYYPEPGAYFGVPVSNFVGWAVVGSTIMILFALLERRVKGEPQPPGWAARLPLRPLYGPGLYYVVLGFILTVTWMIGEKTLFLVGVFAYGPLTVLLAATILMRWREGQRAFAGNLQTEQSVVVGGDVPTNGRGSLAVEAVWKDHTPE
ncbi:MAG: carotenoid biosynthesis protein [Candidatus Methylomirabilales bacterium]